jgi:mannose-6-phosphate isomerase-like protein (cupin superfamily)
MNADTKGGVIMMFGRDNVFSSEMDGVEIIEIGSPIVGGKEKLKLKRLINDPAATVSLEDFLPGEELNWAFWHDEVHLVISGKAEIHYTLPPSHNRIRKKITGRGDTYLILNGSRVKFKVISREPYRHYCVIMPRYHYEKWLLEDAIRV